MTSTTKTGIVLVLILAVLIFGVIWSISNKNIETPLEQEIVTPTPTPKLPNTAGTGMSDINDDSEEGLKADLNALDKQITDLNGDISVVDYGITNINK